MSGCDGGRSVQRERDVRRAVRAVGKSDWEIRIDAWVWCGVGEVGDRFKAVVIKAVQVFSAHGSRLEGG